jgi:hypothetical protein
MSHIFEEFDYTRPMKESCPDCTIQHFLEEFYPPGGNEFEYRKIIHKGVEVWCVLIKKPFLSKLIIYYQHRQWQYVRYDYDVYWKRIESQFLDLRDCIDIFADEKNLKRFVRSIWNCHGDWLMFDEF